MMAAATALDLRGHPLVVCAAVTGSRAHRQASPHHPIYPQEVVESAICAWRAGAAVLHLHGRKADGTPSSDPSDYRSLGQSLRGLGCDAVLHFSGGDNGGRSTQSERLRAAEAGPEVVSIAAGSFDSGERLYNNEPAFREDMVSRLSAANVKAEFEVYDTGQLEYVKRCLGDGHLRSPLMLTLVLGIPGGMPICPDLLQWLVRQLPATCHWSLCCQTESATLFYKMQLLAFSLGGHIRTGFEDVDKTPDGRTATSNAALVEPWGLIAAGCGRALATPMEARTLLGLPAIPNSAGMPDRTTKNVWRHSC